MAASPSGIVPIRAYDAQDSRLKSIERWDPATYQRVSTSLSDGRKETEAAIAAKAAELDGLSDTQVEEKLAAMDELGALHGAGTDEQVEYAEMRSAVLSEPTRAPNSESPAPAPLAFRLSPDRPHPRPAPCPAPAPVANQRLPTSRIRE